MAVDEYEPTGSGNFAPPCWFLARYGRTPESLDALRVAADLDRAGRGLPPTKRRPELPDD